MNCDLEGRDLQAAIGSGDPKTIKLRAIAHTICKLRVAQTDMIDRNVIGRGFVLDRINGAIDDLKRERDVIKAAVAPFPPISPALLTDLATAVNVLDRAVGTSQAAQEFAVATGDVFTAVAKVAQ
jgi:hypothetical protein